MDSSSVRRCGAAALRGGVVDGPRSPMIWAMALLLLACSSSGGGGSTEPQGSPDIFKDTGLTAADAALPDARVIPPDATPTWPPIEAPWMATSVPFDRSCTTGCEEIAVRDLEHVGLQVRVLTHSVADDAISQWSDCVQSVMRCIDDRGTPDPCVSDSACPVACRREFARRAALLDGDPADEGPRLDLFESLFIASGASCGPGSAAGDREGGEP